MILNRPNSLFLGDPLHAGRWPRKAPLFDPKRSKALDRQVKAARKARRREEADFVRSLELGAKLHRDRVLQEAEVQLRRSRRGNPALEMLHDTARQHEREKRARELEQRRATAIADFRRLRAKIERNWAVGVAGFVPYGQWFRHATQAGPLPRRSMFAPGCFDNWLKVRGGESVELQVEHDGRALRLADKLRVTALPSGIHFSGRVRHDDPGLAQIKSMREVSPGYRVLASKLDQYVNADHEEQQYIIEAALDELSFVPASANPGSWFALTDPREEAAV